MVSEPVSILLKTFHKFATTLVYTKNSKMLEGTIWATDIENLSTASMLESGVFVFSAYVDRTAWQHFQINREMH